MSDHPRLLYASLTPLVVQVNWKVLTEFPACPDEFTDDALLLYETRLTFAAILARNHYGTSLVVDCRLYGDDMVVLTRFAEKSVKNWGVAHISICDGVFHHRSEGTFFTLQGALKHFCGLVNESISDSIDDYC